MPTALDNKPDEKNIGDEHFQDLVNRNWSPAERQDLSNEASAGGQDADSSSSSPSKKGLNPSDVAGSEAAAASPSPNKTEAKEADDTIGGGYRDEGKKKSGGRGRLSRRQKFTGGGIIGLIVGGGFGLFSVMHGPMQLMHLGQVLGKFSGVSDNSISIRNKGFFKMNRYQQTGDAGETRVTRIGSKRFHNVMEQLDKQGIAVDRRDSTGRAVRFRVDESRSPLRGSSPQKTQANIARHFNINPALVQIDGGVMSIDTTHMTSRQARAFAGTTLDLLGDGKIPNAMNKRVIAKFWGTPSLFHPFERLGSDLQNKWDTRAARLAGEKERKNKNSRKAKLKGKYLTARDNLAKKVQPHRASLTGALMVTGGLCILKESADIIPLVNYAHIVVPAMNDAVDMQAVGGQTQAADDFYMQHLANTSESLVDDDGKTIWSAKSLHALQYGGAGQGEEMPANHKQAFYYKGGSIANLVNNVLSQDGAVITGTAEGLDATAGYACSGVGYIAQGVVGGVLLLTGPGGWLLKGFSTLGSAAVMTGALYMVNELVEKNLTEDLLENVAGVERGHLLAHGARAAANLNAMSAGGVALSETEERIAWQEVEDQYRAEFQQKSLFARVFDVYDHRSLASSLMRPISPSLTRNTSSVASAFTNPLSMVFGSASSVFTDKAQAAEGDYDWGFPLYAVPQSIISDTKYEDPYDNAEKAAAIFKENARPSVGAKTYIEKVKTCFGVNIAKGEDGLWDAIQEEEVNPIEEEYLNAGCNDLSDERWTRVTLFVFDSSIVRNIECYEGDKESCVAMGNQSSGGQEPGELPPASPGGGFVGQDTATMSCKVGTDAGLGDTPDPNKKVRLCSVGGITVNVVIEQNVKTILDGASAAGINGVGGSGWRSHKRQQELRRINGCPDVWTSPSSSCRTPTAIPGRSQHEWGLAVDFTVNRVTIKSRHTALFQWLGSNQSKHQLINLPSEPWHWSTTGK